MANSYEPKTNTEARASIQAHLDKIVDDFSKSLRMCNEAAEFLLAGSEQKRNEVKTLKLKPTRPNL